MTEIAQTFTDLAIGLLSTGRPCRILLLGNLLCAVVHLLDGGPLAGILNLIDRINDLL